MSKSCLLTRRLLSWIFIHLAPQGTACRPLDLNTSIRKAKPMIDTWTLWRMLVVDCFLMYNVCDLVFGWRAQHHLANLTHTSECTARTTV